MFGYSKVVRNAAIEKEGILVNIGNGLAPFRAYCPFNGDIVDTKMSDVGLN